MSEWFKVHAWKACIGESLSGVRIPLFPFRSRCFAHHSWKTPPDPEGSNGIQIVVVPKIIWAFFSINQHFPKNSLIYLLAAFKDSPTPMMYIR